MSSVCRVIFDGRRNNPVAAIGNAQEALGAHPHFLRGLNLIGVTLASNGNAKRGAEVLRTATHLYPNDGGTGSALGTSLELLNEEAAAATAYRRAITLEEGFATANASLGCIASSKGDWQTAIAIFRRGRGINSISS